jgi:hypothetical protein
MIIEVLIVLILIFIAGGITRLIEHLIAGKED